MKLGVDELGKVSAELGMVQRGQIRSSSASCRDHVCPRALRFQWGLSGNASCPYKGRWAWPSRSPSW